MTLYEEFLAPASISDYVHCIWMYEQLAPGVPDAIVPDGRPELIIHIGKPYLEAATGLSQPEVLFAGQLTKPLEIHSTGHSCVWGVRFRPDGAGHFLGHSLEQVTDRRIDMAIYDNQQLRQLPCELRSLADATAQIECIVHCVASMIGRKQPDPIVRGIVDQILSDRWVEFPQNIHIRQVQRRFKRETGISIRTLKSIRRFRSVFDRLQSEANETWVQRALEVGYFDQPQLARDFKRFLGCSARAWVETTSGLGKALGSTQG